MECNENPSSIKAESDENSEEKNNAIPTPMKSNVKDKISQLEAYSRQLCHNLRNLQKNRAILTNEAVALSKEIEGTEMDFREVSCEPNVCVLLGANEVLERNAINKIRKDWPCGEDFTVTVIFH